MTAGSIEMYGLRIAICSEEAAGQSPQADLVWRQQTATQLPGVPAFFTTTKPDGVWTHHIYGPPQEARLEFVLSPDGRTVTSTALPSVPEQDLFALFAEPVMRSILRIRRLPSFHGAALARDGEAILLLGSKGAGKSTLSAMLMRRGWSLLTDDLARVQITSGRWAVTPGFRQLKLTSHVAQALGFAPSDLQRRWSAVEAPNDPVMNKYVIRCEDDLAGDVPLRTVYLLGDRGPSDAPVQIHPIAPIMRLLSLVNHASEDPVSPGAPRPRETMEAAGAILGSGVPMKQLVVPDNLSLMPNLEIL